MPPDAADPTVGASRTTGQVIFTINFNSEDICWGGATEWDNPVGGGLDGRAALK